MDAQQGPLPAISFEVISRHEFEDKPVCLVVEIRMDRQINGYAGSPIYVQLPKPCKDESAFIRQRVAWKVKQETGLSVPESHIQ